MVLLRGLDCNALRFAFWMSIAPWCHTSLTPDFSCAVCRRDCQGWGVHLHKHWFSGFVVCVIAFTAVANLLNAEECGVCWSSIGSFSFSWKWSSFQAFLACDESSFCRRFLHEHEVFLTWSGLVLCHDDSNLTLAVGSKRSEQYLQSAGSWVNLNPFQRRHYLLFKPAKWLKEMGTLWAYLVWARSLAPRVQVPTGGVLGGRQRMGDRAGSH